MKIIQFIILTCLLSSTTAFSQQPNEIHSFADTSAGYFDKIFMDIKVADGLIIAGLHMVNNVQQPMIAKINVSGQIVWTAAAPSPVPATSYNTSMNIKLFEDGFVYGSYFQPFGQQLLWKVNAQTGLVEWVIPFSNQYKIVKAFTELDATRFVAVYSISQYNTQLAVFNKATGSIIQQSQITTADLSYYNTAMDGYGNLYLSMGNKLRKYNGTDLNQIVWEKSYLDGTAVNHLDDIHQMYLDPTGDIYLFGRNGDTFGHGDGMIVRINSFNGQQIWKVIATSDDVRVADFVDKNNCLYVTYQHTLTGGGTYKWRTAKVAKNNGQILWSNIVNVTPQAGASTNTNQPQAALSLDVDCYGDVYQTGYYGAANYGPGNWGIMKLNGSTGAKLYDLTISEDSTAADTQSQGTVVAVFDNTPVILGQVEIGTSYTTKALYISIDPANGTIVSRHGIMAGYSHSSSVVDIINDGSSSFAMKQVGSALKVKHYLNGNPSWETAIPISDITFGKKLAASTTSVYAFGRKVLSATTPPFYQQATNKLALYKINRSTGAIQNTQLISSLPGDSRPLQLVADNTMSYLFYSKGDSIYYRNWNGTTLSPELLLDSLSQYQESAENLSIIHNETSRLIVATGSGIYQINKSTMAKTPFLAYPQQMEIASVSGMGNTLYIAGRSGSDALAASIDLTASSVNWLATYPTADKFTQISTDGYFLYVSATDAASESIRQLALSDGTENWSQFIPGGVNTISSLTLSPAKNHDYIVVGGKIIEPTGGSNAFITMVAYDGTLLENYILDDELGTESYLSTSAAINDSTIWIGGVYNTASQPKTGRIFSVAYTAPIVNQTITETACLSYAWPATGLTYTASGVYTHTITNPVVDTVLTLNLTINQATVSNSSESACGTYTWNGTTYITSGVYTWNGTNAAGCDSVATLNLTINQATTSSTAVTSCDSYMWNGTVYSTSGVYTWNGTNAAGCDSIDTLNLTINQTTTFSTSATSCSSYNWNGTTYTTSGVYTWTGTNAAGCDSVVTLNLNILIPSTSYQSISSAGPYIWPVTGLTYTISGTYIDTIPNATGCDSIITLFLAIYPLSNVNVYAMPSDITECTGGGVFTLSGVPDFTINIGNGNPVTTTGYAYFDSLCSGIYSAFITDGNGDTLSANFVIPSDSTYIFNNPFIDSLALDSLGTVVDNCDIYYNSIDSAYITNIFANTDTVTVNWEIVDSSGVHSIVTTYILGNGSGVYNLQLSVFCPLKSSEEYFTVTQAIYFDGSGVHLLGIEDPNLLNAGIYPNPTNDLVKIVFTQASFDLFIYDSSGKIISEHTVSNGQQISLAHIQSGVYFFDLKSNDGEHVVKRVVKN